MQDSFSSVSRASDEGLTSFFETPTYLGLSRSFNDFDLFFDVAPSKMDGSVENLSEDVPWADVIFVRNENRASTSENYSTDHLESYLVV